jgi:hypothetical protein
MVIINNFQAKPVSMVTAEGQQRVDLYYTANRAAHLLLNVYNGGSAIFRGIKVVVNCGEGYSSVLLEVPKKDIDAVWELTDGVGNVLSKTGCTWKKPREWTFYVMISSHTDIGLHNSPYIQRHNSAKFLDTAMELCDKTASRQENDRYRYVMEGAWFWNNYRAERGENAARKVVEEYIKTGKIGVCGGIAGNHTQVYGLEEICRSVYARKDLADEWGIDTETMSMIDTNGMSWGLVQPYADAGFKNIIFAPNQWNPLPSTVWKRDITKEQFVHNPDAGGGGSRIDVSYDSALPMVFYWQANDNDSKLLVWASTSYASGGTRFGMRSGMYAHGWLDAHTVNIMEERIAQNLPQLERKYPYDIWLMPVYDDDQEPDIQLTDKITEWNEKWKWPKIRTVGNPDGPFDALRKKFGETIPVLRGEITGGWFQHPLSAADLLAEKFSADRLLPTAEKLSSIAGILDKNYTYPQSDFDNAWNALLFNDEHSYGVSGYQGRRVYETWMQHRDWIEKAKNTAEMHSETALRRIIDNVEVRQKSVFIFNPTAQKRTELVTCGGNQCLVRDIPAFGYRIVNAAKFSSDTDNAIRLDEPPVLDNSYYKIKFAADGSMASIYDKELGRELLSASHHGANQFIYTADNHKTFFFPKTAVFKLSKHTHKTTVVAETEEDVSKAKIIQSVTLLNYEKRIEIDNTLLHLSDMFNTRRYHRYAYYAFPFEVENAARYCNLNGCIVEYGKDLTGHGTDVYLPAHEWCCVENGDFGVALCQLDGSLVEFDRIHPDKTDCGNTGGGSQMFVYLANDWLQMHVPDGDHLNFRFRYAITSYKGGYRKAAVGQLAERFANPVLTAECDAHIGVLKAQEFSFIDSEKDLRLVTLKRARDGIGLIARFYGEAVNFKFTIEGGEDIVPCSVDERDRNIDKPMQKGFITYRVGSKKIRLAQSKGITAANNGVPRAVGHYENGLITRPKAICGENQGQLYLVWGNNREDNLAYYALYRGEDCGFTANTETLIAKVEPGDYCVARYEDIDLSEHTWYYYRVCAVNNRGIRGPISDVFSGLTRGKKCGE